MTALLGQGVYSTTEVTDLTGVPAQRVRAWARRGGGPPLLERRRTRTGTTAAHTFLDLVEVLVAGQLRSEGVTMQSIRRVHRELAEMIGEPHPFAHAQLLTDGRAVFWRAVDAVGREQLVDVARRQHAIPHVLLPYLRQLDYDPSTLLAIRWNIAEGIVVDPQLARGQPVLGGTGIPARAVAAAWDANGRDSDFVGAMYQIPVRKVVEAVEFERRLAA